MIMNSNNNTFNHNINTSININTNNIDQVFGALTLDKENIHY